MYSNEKAGEAMEDTAVRPRRSRRRRRRRRLLPLVILLAVLAVTIPVVLSLLPRQPRITEEPDPHAGQVYVNDGANMVWLTPHENLTVNPFTADDFTRDEDGSLRYTGMTGTVRLGVDVSDYQSGVDWSKLAAQGVDFAILRIGYTGYTKGSLRTDSAFAQHLQGARAAGIDVGVYYFSQAVTVQEAAAEAAHVLRLLDGRQLDLPVYFDWEPVFADDSRTKGNDNAHLTEYAAAFCDVVESAGYTSGIYLNRQQGYYRYDLSRLSDYALWVADYNDYPDFYYAFDMWQYSDSAVLDGMPTQADLNLLFVPSPRA